MIINHLYDVLDEKSKSDTDIEIDGTVTNDSFPQHVITETTGQASKATPFSSDKGLYNVKWHSQKRSNFCMPYPNLSEFFYKLYEKSGVYFCTEYV